MLTTVYNSRESYLYNDGKIIFVQQVGTVYDRELLNKAIHYRIKMEPNWLQDNNRNTVYILLKHMDQFLDNN